MVHGFGEVMLVANPQMDAFDGGVMSLFLSFGVEK